MKKAIIALLLGFAAWAPSLAQCWEETLDITPHALPDRRIIHTVFVLNDSVYWVGGESNVLCATRDGGQTWSFGHSPYPLHTFGRPWIQAVCFLDEDRGFIGTDYDNFYTPMMRTSDGGATWSPVSAQSLGGGQQVLRRVSGIQFATPTHGWAVSAGGYIAKTEDGGDTWRVVYQHGLGFSSYNAVAYARADTLYTHGLQGPPAVPWLFKLMGGEAAIIPNSNSIAHLKPAFQTGSLGWWGALDDYRLRKTEDGGATWSLAPLVEEVDFHGLGRYHAQPPGFANDSLGWAALAIGTAGDTANFSSRIYVTTDGGASWKRQHADIMFPYFVFPANDTLAFLTTHVGRLYRYRGRPAPCGPQAAPAAGNSLYPLLSWPPAEGCYDGYYLQLGSSPGADDLLPRTDVGLDTFYQVQQALPSGAEVFAAVLPYNHVYGAAEGCGGSSFATPECPPAPMAIDTGYCAGGALLWGDSLIGAPGVYHFPAQDAAGCDSSTVLHVAEHAPGAAWAEAAYCAGEAFYWGDSLLAAPGIYEFAYVSAAGCDSLLTLQLSELPPAQAWLDTSYCAGGDFYWEGKLLDGPGEYGFAYTAANGCDSLLSLQLSELPHSYTAIDTALLPGVLFMGQAYSSDTLLRFVYPAANGCDSLVEVRLSVLTGSRAAAPPAAWRCYPNPTAGELWAEGAEPLLGAQLLGIGGARHGLSWQAEGGGPPWRYRFSLAGLPPGAYLLRLESRSGAWAERIVVY
jgi:photosystem II stability/assembly factor-like uncharacterized protein